jgi:hypothetical protein
MSLIGAFYVYTDVRLTFKMYFSIIADFGASAKRFIAQGLDGLGLNFADYIVVISAVLVMIAVGFFAYNRKAEFKNLRPMNRNMLLALMLLAVIIFGVYGFGYDGKQFIYNQY